MWELGYLAVALLVSGLAFEWSMETYKGPVRAFVIGLVWPAAALFFLGVWISTRPK